MTTRSALKSLARRLWRDDRGVISMEFALTFPLLALWFLSSFIFFDAYRSFSQTEKVAFAVNDNISLFESMDDSRLNEMWLVTNKMLPRRTTKRTMRISSICYKDNLYRIMWSYARSGADATITALDDTVVGDVPVDIMPILAEGDSIILTEIYAEWTPLSESFFGLDFRRQKWANRLATKPRYVKLMQKTDENMYDVCPDSDEDIVGDPGSGGTPDADEGVDIDGEVVDLGGNPLPDGDDPDAPVSQTN